MFDRLHFEIYIKATKKSKESVNHYPNGVEYIESRFGVDVDAEYQKDKCSSLMGIIKDEKHFGRLTGNAGNSGSYLNAYVKFLDAIANMEERFCQWLELQPQKGNGTKTYAQSTIIRSISLLKSGLGNLDEKYKGVNCFRIPIADSVQKIYDEVHQLAEQFDRQDGTRDFRNGFEFYLEFLSGGQNYAGNSAAENAEIAQTKKHQFDKNLILYGPPGTGKTYNTVVYAVAIAEQDEKTFEEVSQEANNNYDAVFERYKGYINAGRICFTTFHQSYGYEEFIEGIKPVMKSEQTQSASKGDIAYDIEPGVFKKFCNDAQDNDDHSNYVFIIDEINRGNISKIFGELITLIEPTKRLGEKEETEAVLPYSQDLFGVPNNVYILGTMNTADRSIAAIDTALRRRFSFKEMPPVPQVVQNANVNGIEVSKLLTKINERIEALYDREHTIGHAYFTPLLKEASLDKLADIFKNKIIPLLQEYFYEDYEKIRLVVADNQISDKAMQFIVCEKVDTNALFGSTDYDFDITVRYKINDGAFYNANAYKKIYDASAQNPMAAQQPEVDEQTEADGIAE